MSSGSSNIDPSEFNEPVDDVSEGATSVPETAQDEDIQMQSTPSQSSHHSGSQRRSRRFRQRMQAPPAGVPYRIWIYQPHYEPRPTRQALNRIIFSIARALRTGRSVPARPGLRPGVVYRRREDVITLDVQRE